MKKSGKSEKKTFFFVEVLIWTFPPNSSTFRKVEIFHPQEVFETKQLKTHEKKW